MMTCMMGFYCSSLAHRTPVKALDIREKGIVWLWWELYTLIKMSNWVYFTTD